MNWQMILHCFNTLKLSAWEGPRREYVECIPASKPHLFWFGDAERAFEWSIFNICVIKSREAITGGDTVEIRKKMLF